MDLDRHFPFSDVSRTLQRINMYPYFDVAHYILMCLLVKEDTPQLGAPTFSRKHPFASWLASMLMCFSGGIIGNALTGEALISPFQNHRDILLASAVWYILNYSPFDLAYKTAKFGPIHLAVCLLKEVQRTRKLYDGVAAGVRLYPQAYLLNVLIGLVKGSGSAEMKLFERLIRGVWLPAVSEFLQPTATTKACVLVCVAFLLEHTGTLPTHLYRDHIYLGAVLFFMLLKLSGKLLGLGDPFAPLERVVCALFFGGLADALGRVFGRQQRQPAAAAAAAALDGGPAATANGPPSAASNGPPPAAKSKADKKKQ